MFQLKIHNSGAAFDDAPEYEVARILRELADKVEAGRTSGRVFDLNGNACGNWAFDKAEG